MKKWFIASAILLSLIPAVSNAETFCIGVNAGVERWFGSPQSFNCDRLSQHGKFLEHFPNAEVQVDSPDVCVFENVQSGEFMTCKMKITHKQIIELYQNDGWLRGNKKLTEYLFGKIEQPKKVLAPVSYGAADWKAEAAQLEDAASDK